MTIMKRKEIIELLHRIEEREEIEILYACEAGSRALEFANDDSNHDIRFIYKKPNVKDYLSLEEPSDMIECVGDDLDIIGWDIRKALMLHYKSDSVLRECFISSLVYIDKGIESIFSGLGGFDIDVLKNDYASIAHNRWKMYCTLELIVGSWPFLLLIYVSQSSAWRKTDSVLSSMMAYSMNIASRLNPLARALFKRRNWSL